MSQLNISPDQSECLSRVVEATPQVCRRHQFFVWSQGDFQRWLPHKISICGSYSRDHRDLIFDVFNSTPVPDDVLGGLKDAKSSFIHMAMQAWRAARQQACVLSLAHPSLHLCHASQALLQLGFEQCVLHGTTRPGRREETESFFVFVQPASQHRVEHVQAMEVLLPCLYMAYQRVCITERQMFSPRGAGQAAGSGVASQRIIPITEREREILVWVRDGLSNHQISEKLGISALTVKNHVQKILRKLGAANRAQAVAKAMTMNALSSATMSHMSYGDPHY